MTRKEFNKTKFKKGMNVAIDSPEEFGVFCIIGVDFENEEIMIDDICNSWIKIEHCSLT